MTCFDLNIKPCFYCHSRHDPSGSSSWPAQDCIVNTIRLEIYHVKNMPSPNIKDYIMEWLRPRRDDLIWLETAIRVHYPEYLNTYKKMLVLS